MMTSHLKTRRPVRRRKRRRLNWRMLKKSCGQVSVWGGGLYEELAVGDIHVFPIETCTFDETLIINCGSKTLVIFVILFV